MIYFLQVTKNLQAVLPDETHRGVVSLSTAAISNVLLLRLFNLASRPDPTESKGESRQDSVSMCRSSEQKCHHGDPCVSMGRHTTSTAKLQKSTCSTGDGKSRAFLVSKRLFDKIQKVRNNLAHGGDVLIADVLNSFQNVQRYFCSASGKQRELLNKHLDEIQCVEEGIIVLKKAMQSGSHAALDIYTLPRKHTAASRLFLSVARPELVGREDILERLAILMTPPTSVESTGPHSTTCWPRDLLHGPPGIGKTAVVRELSCQLQTSHPHQHTFQATSEITLLADISLFFKLETPSTISAQITSGQLRLTNYLFRTKKSFLLIFEDVTEPHAVMSLLPKNKHCVIFTSSSDHLWKTQQFIPNDVIGVPLQGLGKEDSVTLAGQILADNGCKQPFREICKHSAEMEHLRRFLSVDMMGLPLAVRLVAFQISQDGFSSINLSAAMIEQKISEKRSRVDEKAAGRIHVRGFYHVVRYAITNMSNDRKALVVSFALSVFKCCGPPLPFLELLLHRLCLTSAEVNACLVTLMKKGLVTLLGEDYSMHQVVQSHVRMIVSSSFKEVKDSVVSALLQIFKNGTVLSTRMRLSEKADRFSSMPTRRCFSAQHNFVCSDFVTECDELTLASVITDFLDKADSLHLTWKERNTCLNCLLWCYKDCPWHISSTSDCAHTGDVLDRAKEEFAKFRREIESYDLNLEDDETVRDILSARWKFLEFNSVQIFADISRQNEKRPEMCLITLLHLGGEALLATWQHQSVEELYQWFGISVNYLIGQFEENADERFCHCALTYAKAISSCEKFRQSCDVTVLGFARLAAQMRNFHN